MNSRLFGRNPLALILTACEFDFHVLQEEQLLFRDAHATEHLLLAGCQVLGVVGVVLPVPWASLGLDQVIIELVDIVVIAPVGEEVVMAARKLLGQAV